jgi:BCD family chlorophyll transporter-like MFS transporter
LSNHSLGWFGIFRLGLVQASIGAIVVLTTSTMNRIMVVELALPAVVPGALVGLHYAVQFLRPVWGHGSDVTRRRTPWIIGGVLALAIGATIASASIIVMGDHMMIGLAIAVPAFVLIGFGVGAAGTSVLALLSARADADKRAGAATVVWLMMIAGIAITAITVGKILDPYSPQRLAEVAAMVGVIATLLTGAALFNLEGVTPAVASRPEARFSSHFGGLKSAVSEVWADRKAQRFTIFVFVSMLAYSAQDLILEPFAGSLFGFTPGQSTELSGVQHGGVFAGMLFVGIVAKWVVRGIGLGSWSVLGCLASGAALLGLSVAAFHGPPWPISANVFVLGFANGAFAVAAIGSMMALAKDGRANSEGVRMGVWGAAQGLAFGLGGFMGTVAVDVVRGFTGSAVTAYGAAFFFESLLFLTSAVLAYGLLKQKRRPSAGEWLGSAVLAGAQERNG